MFSISTMVQQDNFLTYIKNSKYAYYYPLFVFILETALRVGEVCGLTWDDVDEYSCAVTPQVRQTGNRLSGLAGTAYASLLT